MPLHTEYRPNTFDEFIGNSGTVAALQGILSREAEDKPHALLFTGPSGCGKTTLARLTRIALDCSDNDYREIDSADFRGIDSIREIRQQLPFRPLDGKCRVWLLDECHQLSKDAQNALLKALEDTPPHAYLILATTDAEKLLPTIRSRCSSFSVTPLPDEEMEELIQWVSNDLDVALDTHVRDAMVRAAKGAPRTALVLLDKVLDLETIEEQLKVAKAALVEEALAIDLCRSIFKKATWTTVAKQLKALQGEDPEGVRRAVLGYCASVLLNGKDDPHAYLVLDAFREPTYSTGWPGIVAACYAALDYTKEESG